MYPLFAFLAAVNILFLARFLAGKSPRLHFGYLLTNVAMLATHYYAVFLIAVTFPILFILARNRWRDWLPVIALSGLLCIGPVLSAKYLATPVAGGDYEGIGFVAIPGMVWGLLTGYTMMPTSEEFHRLGVRAILPYVPIVAVVLALTALVIAAALREMSVSARVLLLGILGGVLLGPLAISSIFQISINPRYATAGTPAFIVLLALGLAALPTMRFGIAIATAMVLVTLGASFAHLADPGHGREDVFAASKWLDENVPNSEEILFTSHEFALLSNYHWPKRRLTLYPSTPKNIDQSNVKFVAENISFSGKNRVIFMIGREWVSDRQDLLEMELRNRYENCGGIRVRGIRILCLSSAKLPS